jgi:hypothetical protein
LAALAFRKLLPQLQINAFTSQIGPYSTDSAKDMDYADIAIGCNVVCGRLDSELTD